MHFRRAFAAQPLSFRHLPKSALAVTTAALMLAACGGGGGNNDDEMVSAYTVVGQTGFETGTPNGGSATPSAKALNSPQGNVATNGTVMAVADSANNRVLIYSPLPNANGASASVVLGQTDFGGRGAATTQAGLAAPTSVFISNDGKLVVTDQGNSRVLIWNSVPTTSGKPADVVVGQAGFTSQIADVSATAMSGPTDAIITLTGKLVVADRGNNRVLVWNTVPATNGAAASLVLGQVDFTTNVEDDEAEDMKGPQGVWSDGTKLLVADTGNNRVLYWPNFPQKNDVKAGFVVGQSDFSRSNPGASSVSFSGPQRVSSDSSVFYVADSSNNRVLRFDSMPSLNGPAAGFVFGQVKDKFGNITANDDDQDGKRDDNPTERTLSNPTGALVFNNNLYVTDTNNHRILFFAP